MKKRLSQSKTVLSASFLAALLTACEFPKEGGHDSDDSEWIGLEPGHRPGEVALEPAPGQACFSERFTQPESPHTKSLDLLFVTDTSGSLDEERRKIAEGIDSFVSELPADVDFSIGVMLGHGSKSKYSGRLYNHQANGKWPVLNSRENPMSKIRAHLKNNLMLTKSDGYSDGGEEGMFSMLRGLQPSYVKESQGHGFFRKDAALAVVFIADENDICAKYPAGVKPVPDPDGAEKTAFARDCAGITAERVVEGIRALKGDQPSVVGAIIYDDLKTVPRGGENEYGYGYVEMVKLGGGITIDIAKGHYDEGLSRMGSLVARKLLLQTVFKLQKSDIDPASIQVKVDGEIIPHEYNAETNEVKIADDAGRSGSVVDIAYCEKQPESEPSPEPSSEPTSSPTVTPSPSPTVTPAPSLTPTPTVTPAPTVTPEPSPSPSPSPAPCEGPTCNGGVIGV